MAKKPKIGRPRLQPGKLVAKFGVSMPSATKKELDRQAKAAGQSLSAYLTALVESKRP